MAHRRRQVRVPISGRAVVSNNDGISITANTKDISKDGLGIEKPTAPLTPTEYQIQIRTDTGKQIQLKATLVHNSSQTTGFKTSQINEKNIKIIADLVAEYQTTDDFIKQLDEHDLLEQKYIDEDGNEVIVTFDMD